MYVCVYVCMYVYVFPCHSVIIIMKITTIIIMPYHYDYDNFSASLLGLFIVYVLNLRELCSFHFPSK